MKIQNIIWKQIKDLFLNRLAQNENAGKIKIKIKLMDKKIGDNEDK